MLSRGKWFDRKFTFDHKVDEYPLLIERLRGTPARVEDRIKNLSPDLLTKKVNDTWSIQENVGHLLILESLWIGRVGDLLKGSKELRSADLSNTRTEDADFNTKPLEEILIAFKNERARLVSLLEGMNEKQVLHSALHPRLKQPMRTLDLAYFIAEHDDHHLAHITELLREA
jgi:uncharacterized damage-inducible protein DinB